MQDVFGNYVIQRILERQEDSEVQLLFELMCGHIQDLALNMYGCRVVQSALEVGTSALLLMCTDVADGRKCSGGGHFSLILEVHCCCRWFKVVWR